MARDTADTNLVRGAAMAAGGGIKDYGLAAAKGMTDIGKSFGNLGAGLAKELGEMSQRFDDFADAELARQPNDMLEPDRKRLMEQLERRKKDWIIGGKKDREMIKFELEEEGQTISQWDEVRQNLAKNNKSLNKKFKTSTQGQSIVEAMQGPVKKDANGRRGYYITNNEGKKEFKTLKQVNEIINQNTFDKVSKNVIDSNIDKTISNSKNSKEGETFNYTQELMNYENIITKGNVTSLATQEHVPGRIFYDDLQEMLVNNTYGDLGVKPNKVNRFDPTPETVVTPEDAKVIADKLMENKRLTQRYLATYFTNYAEQNWNNSNPNKTNDGEPDPEGTIYKDHDKSWDYKMVNGRWQAKRKSGGSWQDIHDKFPSSVAKLNKKYPNAGGGNPSSSNPDPNPSPKNNKKTNEFGDPINYDWEKNPDNLDPFAPKYYYGGDAENSPAAVELVKLLNDEDRSSFEVFKVSGTDVRYTSNNFVKNFKKDFSKYGFEIKRIKNTNNPVDPDKIIISHKFLDKKLEKEFKVNWLSGSGMNNKSAKEITKYLQAVAGRIQSTELGWKYNKKLATEPLDLD